MVDLKQNKCTQNGKKKKTRETFFPLMLKLSIFIWNREAKSRLNSECKCHAC